MLVGGAEEGFGDLAPLIHFLHRFHDPLAIPRGERLVDERRMLVHELLNDRATARLGVGFLVEVLEKRGPGAAVFVRVLHVGPITKPSLDPLQSDVDSCLSTLKFDWTHPA